MAHGRDGELEQVGTALRAPGERLQGLLHGGVVARSLDLLQPGDLLVADTRRHFQDIQAGVLRGLVLVHPDDHIQPLVDPGLPAGGGLFDPQLGHAGLDGFGHAAEFLHFLDDLHGFPDDAVGQGLHVVGAAQGVHDTADLGLFLDDDLGVAGDAGGKVGGQPDGFVEGVGVQGLGAAQHRREALQGRADDVVVRVLLPSGSSPRSGSGCAAWRTGGSWD